MHFQCLSSLVLLSLFFPQGLGLLHSPLSLELLPRTGTYDDVNLEPTGGDNQQMPNYGGTFDVPGYPGDEEFILQGQKDAQQILDAHAELQSQDPNNYKKPPPIVVASQNGNEYQVEHQGREQNNIEMSVALKERMKQYVAEQRAPRIQELDTQISQLDEQAEQAAADGKAAREKWSAEGGGDKEHPLYKEMQDAYRRKDEALKANKQNKKELGVLKSVPTHVNNGKCPECKIASDHPEGQDGAKQIAFQADENGKAVPFAPCSGNGGTKYGCADVQAATGAEDLTEKAKLLCTRDEYGEWPISAKFRRDIACALPPRPSSSTESKKETPATSKTGSVSTAQTSTSAKSTTQAKSTSSKSTSVKSSPTKSTPTKSTPIKSTPTKSASTRPTRSKSTAQVGSTSTKTKSSTQTKSTTKTSPKAMPKPSKPAKASAVPGARKPTQPLKATKTSSTGPKTTKSTKSPQSTKATQSSKLSNSGRPSKSTRPSKTSSVGPKATKSTQPPKTRKSAKGSQSVRPSKTSSSAPKVTKSAKSPHSTKQTKPMKSSKTSAGPRATQSTKPSKPSPKKPTKPSKIAPPARPKATQSAKSPKISSTLPKATKPAKPSKLSPTGPKPTHSAKPSKPSKTSSRLAKATHSAKPSKASSAPPRKTSHIPAKATKPATHSRIPPTQPKATHSTNPSRISPVKPAPRISAPTHKRKGKRNVEPVIDVEGWLFERMFDEDEALEMRDEISGWEGEEGWLYEMS